MNPIFPPLTSCVLLLLQEKTDPNGKHLEYRDSQGKLFAKMTKVYKKGGLFGLFPLDNNVHAELRDAQDTLLLTTTSYWGDTKRGCRVDIRYPDGTLLGFLYDASFGVDFTLPDDTLVGTARRPNDRPTEPMEVVHTYADGAGQIVGTCDCSYPDQSSSLLDFLVNGGINSTGRPVTKVTLETAVEPVLHTFLILFPALQHVRFSRSG